ncbi:MAG: hypothetical protein MMC33_004270 [Icmadophila ericetorum]|nr:hypothetical protein [Icmadophila ericetorum]
MVKGWHETQDAAAMPVQACSVELSAGCMGAEEQPDNVQAVAPETGPKPMLPVEKMLSKKEIKAKEMEELAKTLVELGIAAPAAADEEGAEAAEEKRKKKKKDKKPKATEVYGEFSLPETNGTAKENEPVEEPVEEESSESLDPAEVRLKSSPGWPVQAKRLLAQKKAAAQKKQTSSAAAAAAREAKERAKKAKGKKDKSHFNQVIWASVSGCSSCGLLAH